MNHISIDKLYNPQYDLLSVSDKKVLLNTLAAIYNLELICFKEFKAFEKSTYTAVYRSNDGIEFVFVPGDTVTLGLNFKNKSLQDIFNDETYDEDLKFENVIDENIVNDFDDIEFRINTYNEHAGSYSYVLTKVGDEYYFVDTLTDGVSKDKLKAEEHCINKYVNYYSKPRFRYSNSIKNRDISLNSILKENTLNKNFVINSITYDLMNNKCDVELNEIR